MNGASISVVTLCLKRWMRFQCRHCGKVLAEGQFSVAITIKYDDGVTKNHNLCIVPPVVCCRGAEEVQQLFATLEEATSKSEEISRAMRENCGSPDLFTFWLHSNFIEIP